MEDIPIAINSPKFFARKVVSDAVADALEAELLKQGFNIQ